jgi:hypothetical protein
MNCKIYLLNYSNYSNVPRLAVCIPSLEGGRPSLEGWGRPSIEGGRDRSSRVGGDRPSREGGGRSLMEGESIESSDTSGCF